MWHNILEKNLKGIRITAEEALILLEQGDLLELGKAAQKVCYLKHPQNLVTFVIDRNINYTNVCTAKCKFCAFYKNPEQQGGYTLHPHEIYKKVEEAISLDATQIMLQGGLNPNLKIDYYEDILRGIKKRYDITVHSFSPPEIVHIANNSLLTIPETLKRLQRAGLDSLPGGGAEILDDRVRKHISPEKISAKLWLDVMEEAHDIGMNSTATMMMGSIDEKINRIEHLDKLRELQDKTGGFRAFIMWTYQPGNTELGGNKVSSHEYLKTLAVSRMFLDNFSHIQGSWVTQGPVIGQLTLMFGADDLGSIMLEENVVKAAGTSHQMSKSGMINLIKSAGKKPAQRNTKYEIISEY